MVAVVIKLIVEIVGGVVKYGGGVKVQILMYPSMSDLWGYKISTRIYSCFAE